MRERTARRAAALTLLWLAAFCCHAAAPPHSNARRLRIGVATMQPGEIFFERFGHDAIVIDDPAKGEPISYNFGFFDLDEPGFLGRFVDNKMQYQLVALPFAEDMVHYRETGRGVSIQWLDLTNVEAERLEAKLIVNALPEHARYRYQYFTDNCATRVRDALDDVLGGALRPQFEARSIGNTYRSEAVRLASPAPWMWLGFDIGLGPSADLPNSLWQDAFVPMRLAEGLREVRRSDGRPLVKSEQRVLPHRIAPEPSVVARPWWPWLLAGLAVAAAICTLAWRARRAAGGVALVFWTASSIVGLLMAFIWLGTAHTFGWANQSLLLFNPLALLLLPGAWRIARGRAEGRLFRGGLWTIAACVIAALFAHWLPLQPQRNAHWIALLAPIQIAWLIAFTRTTALPR